MGSQKDRRRWPRANLNLLVQYRFETFDDFMGQYASDISEGGMFIRCDDAHEEGSMIYLQFSLRDGTKLIEGLGRVVRVNPASSSDPGMGIEFVSFDDASRDMIEAVVRERRAEVPTEDLETTESAPIRAPH